LLLLLLLIINWLLIIAHSLLEFWREKKSLARESEMRFALTFGGPQRCYWRKVLVLALLIDFNKRWDNTAMNPWTMNRARRRTKHTTSQYTQEPIAIKSPAIIFAT
jgi:hypothetical protein